MSSTEIVFHRKLASANKEITEPLLRELADTEEANRTGKMTVSGSVPYLISLILLDLRLSSLFVIEILDSKKSLATLTTRID
jgi:hypothetical protein